MQRALREDRPSRLRQRLEAIEARAKAAEEEAQKAKSALAKMVVDSARAETDAKDAQDQIRAELQSEIDELRIALRSANATDGHDTADLSIPQEAKDALKEKLARRLETMQATHSRNLEALSKDAEARVAHEVESEIKKVRTDWERSQKLVLAERDQYWKDELKRRLQEAESAETEPTDPFAAAPDTQAIPDNHKHGIVAIAFIAAAIGFSAAHTMFGSSVDTVTADRPAETAHASLTTADSPSVSQPAPVAPDEAAERAASTDAESPSTPSAQDTPSPQDTQDTPSTQDTPTQLSTDEAAAPSASAEPAVSVASPETTPPTASEVSENPVAATDTAPPASSVTVTTTRVEAEVNERAETIPERQTPAETTETPPTPKAQPVATPTKTAESPAQQTRIENLREQTDTLRQKLEAAEKRERAATINALSARIELEEARSKLEALANTPAPTGVSTTVEQDDFFFPLAE